MSFPYQLQNLCPAYMHLRGLFVCGPTCFAGIAHLVGPAYYCMLDVHLEPRATPEKSDHRVRSNTVHSPSYIILAMHVTPLYWSRSATSSHIHYSEEPNALHCITLLTYLPDLHTALVAYLQASRTHACTHHALMHSRMHAYLYI